MAPLRRHVLPEDHDQGAEGDTSWFERYPPFIQAETRRQVQYKRKCWPDLPDGEHRKRRGYTYPHILPADSWKLNLFEPVREPLVAYLGAQNVELHSEAANLRSSQVCCFNFLFPLRLAPEATGQILAPTLPGVAAVESLEFEVTGDDGATSWLGEPPGGKRGQNRTSIDAAAVWRDLADRKHLTLFEWKYTEEAYGTCGGYRSKGNPAPERCRSLDIFTSPASQCFLASGDSSRTRRRYWEHLRSPLLEKLTGTDGCPFQGPLYQLMRQELLADYFRRSGEYADVAVVALHFAANEGLRGVPNHLCGLGPTVGEIWKTATGTHREVSVEKLMAAFDAAPVSSLKPWRVFVRDRYGV